MPTCHCEHCGRSFHQRQSRIDNGRGKFCSKPCSAEGQKKPVTFECRNCGKIVKTVPSDVRGSFCGRECSGIHSTRTAKEEKGSPIIDGETVYIPLGNEKYAIVDKHDWESIPEISEYNWSTFPTVYGEKTYNYVTSSTKKQERKGAPLLLHRLIMGAGENEVVDHDDFDGLNNTRKNLKVCTSALNVMRSRRSKKEYHTSKYRGVSKYKKRYVAILQGKRVGSSKSEVEAARMYNKAAFEKLGYYAVLNHIEEDDPSTSSSPSASQPVPDDGSILDAN